MSKETWMKIKVPAKSELIKVLIATERDYRAIFQKDIRKWCERYAKFFARAGKMGTPEAAWLESCKVDVRARERASRDSGIDTAYNRGFNDAMEGKSFRHNPYSNYYSADWLNGWTDGMRSKGLVRRVN